ncbi:Alpha/Beta hydrolase protein [Mycena pura]|uniref:Alpha/Beta hydrolase protein n=1 Tax=Mycena pura TaxID=153505 RepID=A0AAD6Y2H8_9AGAR|nr:Alpha/Beta hydrolase protein [Mycena pura]
MKAPIQRTCAWAIWAAVRGILNRDPSLSDLNDVDLLLTDIDTSRFPQAAEQGIKVHSGFQDTFQRTADGILAGVSSALQSTGVTTVLVTGHSQGAPALHVGNGIPSANAPASRCGAAALATTTGAMLKLALAPSVQVVVTPFGLPRGGNKAWADFLDSTVRRCPPALSSPRDVSALTTLVGVTFVTNQNDPVPTLPPLILGFVHPSGEIHIVDSSQKNLVACPGHDNAHCATGKSLLHASLADHHGAQFVVTI